MPVGGRPQTRFENVGEVTNVANVADIDLAALAQKLGIKVGAPAKTMELTLPTNFPTSTMRTSNRRSLESRRLATLFRTKVGLSTRLKVLETICDAKANLPRIRSVLFLQLGLRLRNSAKT